ncbi:DMT family transporter [Vibrio sp. 10N.222.55.E8]|uniref:DMT family transporter n=1 Tax=Vibrio artabrorum TaxID=446374 RepID=UPI003550FBEC
MKILLAILAPLLWGTTYAVLTTFFKGWSPFALAVWRALPAGVILLALKPTMPTKQELPWLLLIGLLNIALFFGLLFAAALYLPSTLVGVGMIVLPVIGIVVMAATHKIHPSKVQFISSAILIVAASYLFLTSSASISLISVILLIGSMTALIAGSVATKHVMKTINWYKLLTWKLLFGGLILLPIAYWDVNLRGINYVSAIPSSLHQWEAMAWLVIGLTCIAYGAYVFTIPLITTTELSFFGTINPILAMVLGATVIGEQFSTTQITVMMCMIVSNLAAQTYESLKKRQPEAVIIEY